MSNVQNQSDGFAQTDGVAQPLKIFNPPDQEAVTLRQAFEEYIRPEVATRTASSTRYDFDRFLRFWEQFEQKRVRGSRRSQGPTTVSPTGPIPIQDIRTSDVTAFRDWLVGDEGFSNSTANKAVKLVKRVLRGASEDHDVRSIGTRALPTEAAAKHRLQFSEIEVLWEAARGMKWPSAGPRVTFQGTGIEPSDYWRAILILGSTYGMRIQDLAFYGSRSQPKHYSDRRFFAVTWGDITFDTLNPNPDGHAHNDLGWFTYQASKTGRQYWLPMTRPVRAAIDRLARAAGKVLCREATPKHLPKSRPILPTPKGHQLTEHWRSLQERNGISAPSGSIYELKAFRKMAASALIPIHADLPYVVCGWSTARSDIASKHYLEYEETLVKFMPQVPYPNCFREWTGEAIMPDSTETTEDQA